jgi:hypothetical protein
MINIGKGRENAHRNTSVSGWRAFNSFSNISDTFTANVLVEVTDGKGQYKR